MASTPRGIAGEREHLGGGGSVGSLTAAFHTVGVTLEESYSC